MQQSVSPSSGKKVPTFASVGHSRLPNLIVLALAFAWLLIWYRDTAMSMVAIWDRSDTYAHGFVVAPIALWLVWQNRERFHGLQVVPSVFGILAGALAGIAWLLGELASVSSVSQFALVAMIISLVWAVMGTAVARAYAFPLGFLFFLVPFGEFLFPTMMDWTAHFVIGALRLSGVPVYAEGRSLIIPSGSWQVVEGCSGVRYLIASIVVGSLYAYLNYRSTKRRLVFVVASMIVPILANWMRAYGIVLLGHISDNKIATGVDHIVYGWVFFGIVIMLLFWIGARWREDEPVEVTAADAGERARAATTPILSAMPWVALALVAVLAWKPVYGVLDAQGQHGPVQLGQMKAAADWKSADVSKLPDWSPSYSGMKGEFRSAWESPTGLVGLYIAYYRDQAPGEELINSENRILISKHPVWKQAAYGEAAASIGEEPATFRFSEMYSPETRQLVWSGYWIDGRWTTNDYVAKIYLALSRLAGKGDDSAAVMFYAPFRTGDLHGAEGRLKSFVQVMGPEIEASLRHGMGH